MNYVSSDRPSTCSLSGDFVKREFNQPLMLPLLIDEDRVRRFKYWHGHIRDAMVFRSHIYVYCDSYPEAERAKAFQTATQFSTADHPACITLSNQQYIVWRDVRSLL